MIFQVIDLRGKEIAPQKEVEAASPEDAARQVLGTDVCRSGLPRDLVARVYWQTRSGKSMVRLYSKPVVR